MAVAKAVGGGATTAAAANAVATEASRTLTTEINFMVFAMW